MAGKGLILTRGGYFGHLMQRADPFEKTLMLGQIEGRRRSRRCMAWRAIPGPLSKRKRRLDSLEASDFKREAGVALGSGQQGAKIPSKGSEAGWAVMWCFSKFRERGL